MMCLDLHSLHVIERCSKSLAQANQSECQKFITLWDFLLLHKLMCIIIIIIGERAFLGMKPFVEEINHYIVLLKPLPFLRAMIEYL